MSGVSFSVFLGCVLVVVIGPHQEQNLPFYSLSLQFDYKYNSSQKCHWGLGLSLTQTLLGFHPLLWAAELFSLAEKSLDSSVVAS